MKHCILAKFTPEAKAQRAALLQADPTWALSTIQVGITSIGIHPQLRGPGQPLRRAHSSGYGPRGPAPVRCVRHAPPVEG